jgi:hypothetical protein
MPCGAWSLSAAKTKLGERTSSWASNLRHLAAVEPRGGNRHLVAPKRKKQDATMELLAFVVRVLTACSCRWRRVVTQSRRDDALQCGCPDACRSTMGDP